MTKKQITSAITIGSIIAVLGFLLIQVIPYGRNHTNPAITNEPKWTDTQIKILTQRACFDCHSNETVWPWYSNIAPISWLIQHDVDEGRRRLNFSDFADSRAIRRVDRAITEGEMPPPYYTLMHPQAKLSGSEKQILINGLSALTVAGEIR
jgi:hypothetical protein